MERMEEGRSTFKMLTVKPTRDRPLGRSEDNSRTDFIEMVDSAQDRNCWRALVNEVLKLLVS